MNAHTNVAAATGLPSFAPTPFAGPGEYRLRTGSGWTDFYVDEEWPDDRHGPSLAVWRSKAAADAGKGPVARISRSWFADICMDVIGERAEVQS